MFRLRKFLDITDRKAATFGSSNQMSSDIKGTLLGNSYFIEFFKQISIVSFCVAATVLELCCTQQQNSHFAGTLLYIKLSQKALQSTELNRLQRKVPIFIQTACAITKTWGKNFNQLFSPQSDENNIVQGNYKCTNEFWHTYLYNADICTKLRLPALVEQVDFRKLRKIKFKCPNFVLHSSRLWLDIDTLLSTKLSYSTMICENSIKMCPKRQLYFAILHPN